MIHWSYGAWTVFARNAAELLKLAEDFYKLGVHLVCLKEGFDISTASGRLVFGILAVIAQYERESIIQRTKAGLEATRNHGVRVGRPVVNKQKLDRAIQLYKGGELSVKKSVRLSALVVLHYISTLKT